MCSKNLRTRKIYAREQIINFIAHVEPAKQVETLLSALLSALYGDTNLIAVIQLEGGSLASKTHEAAKQFLVGALDRRKSQSIG